MAPLYFDARDLFRAARLGWSLKKMWTAFCGLLVHYVVYAGCAYTGLALSQGASFRALWAQHGLFPKPTPTPVYYAGAALALCVLLVTACAICRITCQGLKGDPFYASGEAWRFLRSCWRSVILGPLFILALLALFLACGALIGLAGRAVPLLGELGVALLFFPVFFAALVALFIAFALLVALLFAPAIVGVGGDDALEVLIQSFSLLWSQPWRLLLYYAGVLASVKVGVFVLGCLTFYALYLVSFVCGLAMGEKFSALMIVALQYVPDNLIAFFFTGGVLPYPDLLGHLPETGWPSGGLLWAGRLLALSLLLVVGFVLSYALSAHSAGTALIYLILRKKKDGENLLEREDGEEGQRPEAADASEKGGGDEQKG